MIRAHIPEPVLYCPAAQMDAVADEDPAGQAYPALQDPVQPEVVRPVVDPYFPAGQAVHAVAPPVLY